MTGPDDSAHPWQYTNRAGEVCSEGGMTIRQAYVMAAMQGILSSNTDDQWTENEVARFAVKCADACLKAERETR